MITALALITLPLFSSLSPSQAQSPEPPTTWYGFQSGSVAKKTFANGYRAHAVPRPSDNSVTLRYRTPYVNETAFLQNPPVPNSSHREDVTFATRYWPIEFEWIEGTSEALVIGVNSIDGESLIFERWTFKANVDPKVVMTIHPTTGSQSESWALPPRTKVKELYSGKADALGLPQGATPSFIIENRGSADSERFYLGVRGLSTIFHVDLANDTAWPAASSVASTGALLVPELAQDDWRSALGIVHGIDGLVYRLYRGDKASRNNIFLVDTDGDGNFEQHLFPTKATPTVKYGAIDEEIDEYF